MKCKKEEIVERVKDCGQELIDHAEDIVNNFEYGRSIIITCYVDWENDGETPYISVDTELTPSRFIKRYCLNDIEKIKI